MQTVENPGAEGGIYLGKISVVGGGGGQYALGETLIRVLLHFD
jgi:hypothetical protein